MPWLSFFQPAMIALSAAMRVDLRCEVRDVRAGRLELAGAVRAVSAEDLRLLALLDELLRERSARQPGFCVGKNTMSASLGTFVT